MDCAARGPGHDVVTRLGPSGSLSCALGALAYLVHEAKPRADDVKTLRNMAICKVDFTVAKVGSFQAIPSPPLALATCCKRRQESDVCVTAADN